MTPIMSTWLPRSHQIAVRASVALQTCKGCMLHIRKWATTASQASVVIHTSRLTPKSLSTRALPAWGLNRLAIFDV